MLDIYVDADGCPVRDETFKVAQRHALTVHVVSNRMLRVPHHASIKPVVVGRGFDEADDWIAARAGEGDVVVTADLLLAERVIAGGALVVTPKGQVHDSDSINPALATRELMDQLRQMGEMSGGPAPMRKSDKSSYLSALDTLLVKLARHYGPTR